MSAPSLSLYADLFRDNWSSNEMKNMFARPIATAALAVVLAAPAAQAATVSFSALPNTSFATMAPTATTGTVQVNVTNSVPGDRRSPWKSTPADGNPLATTGIFTAVLAGASALYEFGTRQIAATFVWGSPDDYNKVEFLRGGAVVDTYEITPVTNIAPATFRQNGATATFTDIAGGSFDAMRFSSSDFSFEYANLSVAPIPLPAGGLLLIAGLGGLAAMRRRKQLA